MPNNTPIPDAALAELDRLHAAATPGPWEAGGKVTCDCGSSPNCWHQYEAQADIFPPLGESGPVATVSAVEHENAPYIAALHNAYPAMRQRLLAAESRLAEAERERDRWKARYAEEYSGPTRKDRDAQQRRDGALAEIEGLEFYTQLVEQLLTHHPSEIQSVAERVFYERAKELKNGMA